MKKIILITFILSFHAHSQSVKPKKKFAIVLNKNLDAKPLRKKGYIVQKRKVANEEMTELEEEELLIKIGMGEYIEELDSLDRKIMIHRIRNFVPRKLIEYYPDIPSDVLLNAQDKIW